MQTQSYNEHEEYVVMTFDINQVESQSSKWEKIIQPIDFLSIGTGGALTSGCFQAMHSWPHNPNINIEIKNLERNSKDYYSPTEHVRLIKEALGLNMSELASVLDVTRPTVYAWLKGQEPKSEAITKIMSLSKVAERVRSLKIQRIDKLINRQIFEGKSILDKLIENEDVSKDLPVLADIDVKENEARQSLKGSGKIFQSIEDALSGFPVYYNDRG